MKTSTRLPLRRPVAFVVLAVLVIAIGFAATGVIRQTVTLAETSGVVEIGFVAGLLPFAIASYGLRVVRWYVLARQIVPNLRFRTSSHGQIVGFAFSATPGRVAELYKLKLLEEATGTPAARILPAAIVERLTDLAGFGLIFVIGGIVAAITGDFSSDADLLTGQVLAWPAIALGGGAIVIGVWLVRRFSTGSGITGIRDWLWHAGHRLPGGSRLLTMVSQARVGGRLVLSPLPIALAIGCVTVGRLGDSIILWQITRATGYPIPLPLAMLIFGSAGMLGGITFSPGGLGAAEMALVGLLAARGLPLDGAMLGAFGSRALTFWLWVGLGLTVLVAGYARRLVAARRQRPAPLPRPESAPEEVGSRA